MRKSKKLKAGKGYTLVELLISLLVISIGILFLMGFWAQILELGERYKIAGTLYDLLEYSGSLVWNLQSDNDVSSINLNIDHRLSNAVEEFFGENKTNFSVTTSGALEIFKIIPADDGYVSIPPIPIDYKPVIARIDMNVGFKGKIDIDIEYPIILGP